MLIIAHKVEGKWSWSENRLLSTLVDGFKDKVSMRKTVEQSLVPSASILTEGHDWWSCSLVNKKKCFFFSCVSPITGRWWTTCTRWKYVQFLVQVWTSVSPGSVRATWWRGGSTLSKAGTRWAHYRILCCFSFFSDVCLKIYPSYALKLNLFSLIHSRGCPFF